MKLRFLKAVIPFCILLIVCDFLIGKAFEYEYRHVKSGVIRKTTFNIEEMKIPYLVLGSSRASRHYKSSVFSRALQQEFFNCGRDGQEMIYAAAIASAITTRYQPKLIILDVLPEEFTKSEAGKLGALLPYHDHKVIRPFLDYNGKYQNIKLLSKIYPYNSTLTTILSCKYLKDPNAAENGYVPRYGNNTSSVMKTLSEPSGPIDLDKLKVLQQLLHQLNHQKIRTILLISPLYMNYKNGITVEMCRKLSSQFKHVEFVNYTNQEKFMDPRLYSDDFHLNDHGATVFSKDLASRLVVQ